MEHPRYNSRTVQYGHWGITFMDIQTDRSKNFGKIVGFLPFSVNNPNGPFVDASKKKLYCEICNDWVNKGILAKEIDLA